MSKTAAERQRESRQRKRDIVTPQNVTCHAPDVTSVPLGDIRLLADSACLQHYLDTQDKYIPRSEPDKLNWGPWLNSDELSRAGLKANRVPIPGDWDYQGVAA